MPKVIVLFFGAEAAAAGLAEAAAEGAMRVRFTEVDLRTGAADHATMSTRHKPLDSTIRVGDYDGVILACLATSEVPPELSRLLDEMENEGSDAFTNTVFGIAGDPSAAVLTRMARVGGLLVTQPRAFKGTEAAAGALGGRVAKVVGWVRHALSHEHH